MNRRTLFSLAAAFTLGTAFGVMGHPLPLAAGILGIFCCVWKGQTRRERQLVLLAWAGAFLVGSVHGAADISRRQMQTQALLTMPEAACYGRIYKKEVREDRTIYYMNGIRLSDGETVKGSVLLYPDQDSISNEIKTDSRVYVQGSWDCFRQARNEGNFDEKSYYESLGFAAKLYGEVIEPVEEPALEIGERLYQFQSALRTFFERNLPGEEPGVLSSIALGDKTLLDTEVKSMYQASGIAHILAVSGLHVSVVASGAYRFFRKMGAGFALSAAVSAALLLLFARMSGMSASTMRAAGMFLIYLGAEVLGEAYDSLTALGLMAVFLLWQNPAYIRNTGFLFSFGAVLGVSVSAVRLQKQYQEFRAKQLQEQYHGHHKKTLWEKAWDAVMENFLFSLGIQLFTLPMTAFFYYEIPLYGVFLNVCILPFMVPLLTLGLLAGIAHFWWEAAAAALLFPCHLILYVYEMLCDLSLQLPGARQILGQPSLAALILYYFFLFLALYLRFLKRRWRVFLVLGALAVLFWPKIPVCGVDILDVGQGDGIFLQSREGVTFFVDGGSTSEDMVGTYRILPFLKKRGIRKVDYWFLSHLDEDHINGFVECVTAGYPVERLVVAECILESGDERLKEILRLAEEYDMIVCPMSEGDSCGTESFSLECLSPPEMSQWEGANENSLVFLVKTQGFRGLLTGDIGEEQEKLLVEEGLEEKLGESLAKSPAEEPFVLLKAAHHGSNGSNCSAFLGACKAELTVISCGENNSYGHPGKEALARMEELSLPVLVTMDTGQVKIRIEKNGKVWYNSFYETD